MLHTLIYVPFVNILVAMITFLPGHSVAVAIILFTLLLRLVLLIPNRHALESQKKIQALQPEIEALKKKYPDQQEQAQALMALYKENKINPLGSCLPLLIQLPVLIILYQILHAGFGEQTMQALYHFIPRPSFINNNLFGIDLSRPDTTLILPILTAGSQLWQTIITMAASRKQGASMPGQTMFYIFPIMMFFIARQVNAGAVLYWFVTTIFGVGQQIAVNRGRTRVVHADDVKMPEELHAHTPSDQPIAIKEEKKRAKGGVSVTIRRKK